MFTTQDIQDIYNRNFGSEHFYYRNHCKNLIYTDGIMDFQKTLNAYWIVDWVIANLKIIIDRYKTTGDRFFVITITFDKKEMCYIEIYREGYIEKEYCEHITILKDNLFFSNIPVFDYKFYLILSNPKPIQFTLLLTSEY